MKKLSLTTLSLLMGAASVLNLPTINFAEAQSGGSRALNSTNSRIVGGVETEPGEGPWATRLTIEIGGDLYGCGGSLVSPTAVGDYEANWVGGVPNSNWVITAAHCIHDYQAMKFVTPEKIKARTGTLDIGSDGGGQNQDVIAVIPHPEYDPETLKNDIALLILKNDGLSVSASKRSSIRLPEVSDISWISNDYLALYAQGWGNTTEGGESSRLLREVRLPQVRHSECQSKYAPYNAEIAPGMICAGFSSGGFDSCQGDSGGPFIFRARSDAGISSATILEQDTLVGVVSWGRGCARQELYGIYSSTAYYRSWLTKAFRDCEKKDSHDLCSKS